LELINYHWDAVVTIYSIMGQEDVLLCYIQAKLIFVNITGNCSAYFLLNFSAVFTTGIKLQKTVWSCSNNTLITALKN